MKARQWISVGGFDLSSRFQIFSGANLAAALLLFAAGLVWGVQAAVEPKIQVQPTPVPRESRPALSFAPIVKKVAPSVVTIYSTKTVKDNARNPLLNDPTNIPTPGPTDYQAVAAQIRQKLGLQPGSPARGTGPDGTDKGGVRPLGVSISGAPVGSTSATGATLTVGTRLSGSGIPAGAGAWQNGSGWTHYKWNLDGGAFSAETPIANP